MAQPIPSVPGYAATKNGHVLSKRTGRPMLPHPDKDGYLRVRVRLNGRYVNRAVHRLIAEAFHGPCPDDLVCAHLDGSRDNNTPQNLTYCQQVENIAHKAMHGTTARGERIAVAKLCERDVRAIRDAFTGQHGQLTALARVFGVSRVAIRNVVNRKVWSHVA